MTNLDLEFIIIDSIDLLGLYSNVPKFPSSGNFDFQFQVSNNIKVDLHFLNQY